MKHSLSEQLRDDSPEMTTRAENLVAIAEHHEIPIEELIQWIYIDSPGKRWSGAEFRKFASLLQTTRQEALQLKENDPWRRLCPSCHQNPAHRDGNVWRCAVCGEVALETESAG